ncbi:MAG: hypothetical protein ACRDOE_00170 [Streptosporangiaceae bacterium]
MSAPTIPLENLALVAAGGAVTMLGQFVADRRATKRAEHAAEQRRVATAIEELRTQVNAQGLALAELKGLTTNRRETPDVPADH